MSINWPASTPESRRAAAAALGRLGLRGLGLGGYAEDLYGNLSFRKLMERGLDGYSYAGKNYTGLPLPEGISRDDFIFFAAQNAYTRYGASVGSSGLYTNIGELSRAMTSLGMKGDASDVANDFKWAIEPQVTVSADKYLPGNSASFLAANLYGMAEWGYATGSRGTWAPKMSNGKDGPNGGWLYHYLGGVWTIFGVRKIFLEVIGRNPTKQELLEFVLNGRPQTVSDVKNALNAILDRIEKERQKREAAIAQIQASVNEIGAVEGSIRGHQTRAQAALDSIKTLTSQIESVKQEMASFKTVLNGLRGLGIWRPPTGFFGEDPGLPGLNINYNPPATGGDLWKPPISSGGGSSSDPSPFTSSVNTAGAQVDTAVSEIGRILGLVSGELKKANDALAKAGASSGFAEAEALVPVAEGYKTNANQGQRSTLALRDRAIAEEDRVKKELDAAKQAFEDLKAKNRAEFVASKRSYFMTLDNKGLKSEYEKIKNDSDTEILALLIEIARSKGLDLLKKALPYAAIIGGLAVVGGAVWYFKFRKA